MAKANGIAQAQSTGEVTNADIAELFMRLNARMDAIEEMVKDIPAPTTEVHTEAGDEEQAPTDAEMERIAELEQHIADAQAGLDDLIANPPDLKVASADEVSAWYADRAFWNDEIVQAEQELARVRGLSVSNAKFAAAKAQAQTDTDDGSTVMPTAKSLVVSLKANERAIGRLKDALDKDAYTFAKGSLVTVYARKDGRYYARVWTETDDGNGGRRAVSRNLTQAYVFSEFNSDTGKGKLNTDNVRSLSKALGIVTADGKRKRLPSGKRARLNGAAALRESLVREGWMVDKADAVFPAGTEVHERKNGTLYVKEPDGVRTRSVAKQDVRAGKTTKELTSKGEHFTKRMRSKVDRHNKGACGCQRTSDGKVSWVCPAGQALGPDAVTIGAVTYSGLKGSKAEGFDPTAKGVSTVLLAKLNKDAWGI